DRLRRRADRRARARLPGVGERRVGRRAADRRRVAVSIGRDIRLRELDLLPAPVDGGLEPHLLPAARQAVRAQVAARIPAYTPEWTSRRPGDAGVALVHAYGTVVEAVNVRVNHAPRKLALDHLAIAGVRPLQARPAQALLGVQ